MIYALAHGAWWMLSNNLPATIAVRVGSLPACDDNWRAIRPHAGKRIHDAISEATEVPAVRIQEWLARVPLVLPSKNLKRKRLFSYRGAATFDAELVNLSLAKCTLGETISVHYCRNSKSIGFVISHVEVALVMSYSSWDWPLDLSDIHDLFPKTEGQ